MPLEEEAWFLFIFPTCFSENAPMPCRWPFIIRHAALVVAMPIAIAGCSPSEPAKDAPQAVEVEEIEVPGDATETEDATGGAGLTDRAKDTVAAAKEEADRVIDSAKESVESATEVVEEAATEAAETVKEAAESVKEAVAGDDSTAAVSGEPDEGLSTLQAAVASGSAMPPETVLLGDPSLTSGVSGSGPITLEQIDAWLAEPRSHVHLNPELPLGLATGANQITGIDANPMTRAKIELGRQLYFDTRLSKDSTISCASCHNPAEGYAAHTQFGVGIDGQEGGRNSPVSYNRILSGPQFWDGRADSLEAQAVGPIANPIEMGFTHEGVVERLGQIPVYKRQFEAIFGEVTIDHVGEAIATFERSIVTGPSPWDYYEALLPFEALDEEDIADDEDLAAKYAMLTAGAEANPMSDSAKRGRDIFFTEKGNCTACHVGANLADEKYHNLGVGMEQENPDLGRFVVTKDEKDTGAFKTPTVRNVLLTAPYMHDGSQQTLEEVVEWYNKGGHPNPHLSEKVRPLNLTEQDKADLVEFMKACTGPTPSVETSRLPADS